MRIAVAQIGARRHYAVPCTFERAGLLERLFTDSYAGNMPRLERMLRAVLPQFRPKAVDRWLGRYEPRIPPEKVTSFELMGLRYAFRQRFARCSSDLERVYTETARSFNERVIGHGLGSADTVWGFNGAALELFQWAKARGLRCILDQTSAPQRIRRELYRAELDRWADWQPALELPAENGPLTVREDAEWELAELIIAGSTFVAEGLATQGVPRDKCRVVPSGVDVMRFATRDAGTALQFGDRLHVLFVGEVGLGKGAPYVLEALRVLGADKVEGRFAGSVALAPSKLERYRDVAAFLGPVPRQRMPEVYFWADVVVLPSICEGSAMVTYEALAAGIPVICTANTGSIVRDQIDGFIVPKGDYLAIAERLEQVAAGYFVHSEKPSGPRDYSLASYERRLLAAVVNLA